ncbi:MAG: tetratricopeptide repeat protein [Gammaproteobacteria bacterium]|nr:tetratricopeptide repeat protein [Gammaproteobacteria bacterium]
MKYVHHELVSDQELKTAGQALWRALDIDKTFDEARAQTGLKILPLLIQSDDPAINNLPWEICYHPQLGFLGRHKDFTLSRRHSEEAALPPLQKGPLKVLLFTSQPDDSEKARLDTESEQARVLEALAPWIEEGFVELEAPDDGRFSSFKQLLKEKTFHLVFLSGHGEFRHAPHSDEAAHAVFQFESETGLAEAVKDVEIAREFKSTQVQCVVLSTCQSGKTTSHDLQAGLAQQLMRAGLPHVVGMRESLLDRAGIIFSCQFCDALGRQQRVDTALQQARLAIIKPLEDAGADGLAAISLGQWCLPMLLTRDPARPLIDWDFTPVPPKAEVRINDQLANIALPAFFIGRRKELRELGQAFYSGKLRRLLIAGAGGQGKTALAGQLALRLQARGYMIQAYSARPENSWDDFIFSLQMALDKAHAEEFNAKANFCTTPAREARLLLDLLRKQTRDRLVLFLDNLDSVQNPNTYEIIDVNIKTWLAEIQRLGGQGPLLLLTSRWQLSNWNSGDGGLEKALTRPGYGDFLRYVHHLKLERKTGQTLEQSRARLRRLYEALGGNFKGLQFFNSTTRRMSIEEDAAFVQLLGKAQAELQSYMAIDKVVSYLREDERTLLAHLRVYATPVIEDGIKRISDLSEPLVLLRRLVALSLVDVEQAVDIGLPMFEISPLIREWLLQKNTPPPAPKIYQKAAKHQIFFFKYMRRTADQALSVHQAQQVAQQTEQAHRFALEYLIRYFDRRGLYHTLLQTWLPPLRNFSEPTIKAKALEWSGKTCHAIGDYDTALDYLRRSFTLRQEIGDRQGEGAILNNISQIYDARGDYDTALDYLKRSLVISQEIGDKQGEGATFNNISQIYDALGDYDTALDYLKRSLAIIQEIGDKQGEGATLNNISQIFKARGDYGTALDYLKRSLVIRQEVGDKQGEGATLNNISQIFKARGDYDIALDYSKRSLAIIQEIGDKQGEGAMLNNISQIFKAWGNYDTALDYLKHSLAIRQKIGDKQGEGATLNNISTLYHARGDYDTALDYLKHSLAIQQEIGDKQGEGTTLNNISQIYDTRGDYDTALDYLKRSLAIQQEIGDKQGEGVTLNNISTIYQARRDYDTTLNYLTRSLAIRQEIGDKQGEGVTLNNISQIFKARGDYDTALDYLKRSLAILQEIGDKQGAGATLNNISQIFQTRGDYDTALDYLKRSLTILQEIGDRAGLCATLFNMGYIHLQNQEMQEGVPVFITVYKIAKQIGEAQTLEALDGLGKQFGGEGLAFWERLLQQNSTISEDRLVLTDLVYNKSDKLHLTVKCGVQLKKYITDHYSAIHFSDSNVFC